LASSRLQAGVPRGAVGCDAYMITAPNNVVTGWKGSTSTHAGYHGACLVFLDRPEDATPAPTMPPPPAETGTLFRDSNSATYRVQPESFEAARCMGWVPV
jgi:hypothetical protein